MIATPRVRNRDRDHRPQVDEFGWFWRSYAVSAVGSGLSTGALPLVAIVVLKVGALQISLLAAVASISSAVISIPLGHRVDRSEKRLVMITTDLLECAALLSVPIAFVFHALTFVQLCVVATVQTSCTIAYSAAGFAYVKRIVAEKRRTRASARLDTVSWITQSAGPAFGGALIGLAGPMTTLVADAASYVGSAVLLRGLRKAAPLATDATQRGSRRRELFAGWEAILTHPVLRSLYINALVFGGAITWSVPMIAFLMLREMGASPLEYGIALGVPSLGGLVGAVLSPRLVSRLGERTVLLAFGAGRTVWLLPLPFVGAGSGGVAAICASQLGLLLFAGIFNPVFSSCRMTATPDAVMARVSAAWSVSSKSVQPMFIAIGGLVAAEASPRTSLLFAACVCVASSAFLPWERLLRRDPSSSDAVVEAG